VFFVVALECANVVVGGIRTGDDLPVWRKPSHPQSAGSTRWYVFHTVLTAYITN
jgi:hypothetical protein